jgi:hypothetical protein
VSLKSLKLFARKHVWKLVMAVVGGTLGALVDQNAQRIHAYIQKRFDMGPVSGPYVVVVKGYAHDRTVARTQFLYSLDLKQAGRSVFGQMSLQSDPTKTYNVDGYTRLDFLSLAYEAKSSDGRGTGTFAMKSFGESSYIGFWGGVECKGGSLVLMKCPAVFYRSDKNVPGHFEDYIDLPCEEPRLTSKSQSCK